MPIYEIWRAEDGTQSAMFPSDHSEPARTEATKTVDGVQMDFVASFFAARWASAKVAYEAILFGDDE